MADVDSIEWDYQECMRQYNIQQERACDAEALAKELLEALEGLQYFIFPELTDNCSCLRCEAIRGANTVIAKGKSSLV